MNDSETQNVTTDRAVFYPVAVVGAVFCMTIFAVISAAFGNSQAPMNAWLNRHSTPLLLWETGLLVVTGIGAMTIDRIRTLKRLKAQAEETAVEEGTELTTADATESSSAEDTNDVG